MQSEGGATETGDQNIYFHFYLVNLFKIPYLFYYKRKHENMFQYRDRKYQEEKKYKKYSKNMTLIKAAWLLYFILSLG